MSVRAPADGSGYDCAREQFREASPPIAQSSSTHGVGDGSNEAAAGSTGGGSKNDNKRGIIIGLSIGGGLFVLLLLLLAVILLRRKNEARAAPNAPSASPFRSLSSMISRRQFSLMIIPVGSTSRQQAPLGIDASAPASAVSSVVEVAPASGCRSSASRIQGSDCTSDGRNPQSIGGIPFSAGSGRPPVIDCCAFPTQENGGLLLMARGEAGGSSPGGVASGALAAATPEAETRSHKLPPLQRSSTTGNALTATPPSEATSPPTEVMAFPAPAAAARSGASLPAKAAASVIADAGVSSPQQQQQQQQQQQGQPLLARAPSSAWACAFSSGSDATGITNQNTAASLTPCRSDGVKNSAPTPSPSLMVPAPTTTDIIAAADFIETAGTLPTQPTPLPSLIHPASARGASRLGLPKASPTANTATVARGTAAASLTTAVPPGVAHRTSLQGGVGGSEAATAPVTPNCTLLLSEEPAETTRAAAAVSLGSFTSLRVRGGGSRGTGAGDMAGSSWSLSPAVANLLQEAPDVAGRAVP